MQIGNVKLDNPVFLAPMAGVTDKPFRIICKQMGAGLVYTEFVSSNGIIMENKKTLKMIEFTEKERPIGVQIFGDDPEIVGKSAKIICQMFKPDIIDINFGCPVPKIANKGAGSGALKDLRLMKNMAENVINNSGDTPVTVKMRSGWDHNNIISTKAGIMLEEIGVKAITLHPRTKKQMFTGLSNWKLIKDLKNSVSIPVIGNGDIHNADDAIKMFNSTGCDAVMIARGVLGDPWLLQSIKNKLNNKKDKNITTLDRINMCKKHFELLKQDKTESLCVNYTKKHFNWYLKGFQGASEVRKKFMATSTSKEISILLKELKNIYS